MDDLIDLIATDASSSDVSDKIKDLLYAKSSERLDAAKPLVANGMFNDESGESSEPVEQETEE